MLNALKQVSLLSAVENNLFPSCSYSGPQQLKMGIPILVEPIFLQSASRGGSQLTTL